MAQGRGDYGPAFTSKVLIFLPHFSRIKKRIFPFTGGRDHLSHRLMRKGLSKRNTAFALWAMQGFFVGCALIVYTGTAEAGTAVITATGLIWLAAFVWFWQIPSTD